MSPRTGPTAGYAGAPRARSRSRAEMAPDVPHLPPWLCALALAGFLAVFGVTSLIGFRRRALD